MILVDTSVWVDHLRRGDAGLIARLGQTAVLMHPFVLGEIACGNLRDRAAVLELLQDLPAAIVAGPDEVLTFIERRALHGRGVGYVDVHLLTSVALMPGTRLWTRDLRLSRIAYQLGCAHPESAH
ncbi:MAG: type II toxin-antitoxin system VapC family toxin [Lautropia sp.]